MVFARRFALPVVLALSNFAFGQAAAGRPQDTTGLRRELGAAAIAPADAAFFVNLRQPARLWETVRESRAFKKLIAHPTVLDMVGGLTKEFGYAEFKAWLDEEPLAQSALKLLPDLASEEFFVIGGADWIPFTEAYSEIYLEAMSADLIDALQAASGQLQESGMMLALVTKILELKDKLKVPPLIIGAAASKPEVVQSWLDELVAEYPAEAPPLVKEKIGEGEFRVLRFSTRMVPGEVRADIIMELAQGGVPAPLGRKLFAFLDSRELVVAAGTWRKFALFFVGPDLKALESLGKAPVLADAEPLAPLRRSLKPGVLSLSYAAPAFASTSKIDAEAMSKRLEGWLGMMPGALPKDLVPRLIQDVKALVEEFNQGLPEPRAMMSISFLNRGVESLSFSAITPGALDCGAPLSILTHAGPKSMIAVAQRSKPSGPGYLRFAHWVGVAYGYFETFALPSIKGRDREEFDRFQALFMPAIKELHATTRDLLVPAVDAGSSLFVVDVGGKLAEIPESPVRFDPPLTLPRPALVFEIKDAVKLKEAFARYRTIVNGFVARMRRLNPDLPPIDIPEPQSRAHAGGTLYSYPLPYPLGDLEPHALLTGKYVVISGFPDQSKAILEATRGPKSEGVALDAPAGVAYHVDVKAILDWVASNVPTIVHLSQPAGPRDGAMIQRVSAVVDVLRVFKSYSGRVYEQDGMEVHHSWFHIEDLAP